MTSPYDVDHLVSALSRSMPDEVRSLSQSFAQAGFRSWLVGGSVRDIVRAALPSKWMATEGMASGTVGEESALAGEGPRLIGDWDIATDAHPNDVKSLFRRVIPTGIAHGTVTVLLAQKQFEVTTLRGEKGHSDGRRPDEVFFVADLEQDLARRDFTVNAMAYSVVDEKFFDPFSGVNDLCSGVLRAVGDPAQRFAEDGLRVLRCARFCATLGLEIEEKTKQAIIPSIPTFEKVAQERVAEEWFKALKSNRPSRFFRAIKEHGLLSVTAPYLFSSTELGETELGETDLGVSSTLLSLDETLDRIDRAPNDPLLRLACFVRGGTNLEREPPEVARTFCQRLRLSKEQSSRLAKLCSCALLPESLRHNAAGYVGRKWLSEIGRAQAAEVLSFQLLMRPPTWDADTLAARHQELHAELASGCPLALKELRVTGIDLIEEAGISKGPELGKVLAKLFEAVLLDPSQNERSQLVDLASKA